MDGPRELELIALGVLLGNPTLLKELTPGWTWEGGQRENSLYAELALRECGPSMEAWLKRHGVTVAASERASRRIVEVVRQQHAAKRLERLTRELVCLQKLRADEDAIKAKIKELADGLNVLPAGTTGGNTAANETQKPAAVCGPDKRVASGGEKANGVGAKPAARSVLADRRDDKRTGVHSPK